MSGRQVVYAIGSVGFLAAGSGVLLYAIYNPPPEIVATSPAGDVLTGWGAVALIVGCLLVGAFLCWTNDGVNIHVTGGGGPDDPPEEDPDPDPDPAAARDLDAEWKAMRARESDPWAPGKVQDPS